METIAEVTTIIDDMQDDHAGNTRCEYARLYVYNARIGLVADF